FRGRCDRRARQHAWRASRRGDRRLHARSGDLDLSRVGNARDLSPGDRGTHISAARPARKAHMSAVETTAAPPVAKTTTKFAYAVPLIGFGALAVFPHIAGPHYTILMFSAMGFAIALFGLNLLFGYTGLLPFGHAMFLATGAYTTAYLTAAKYLS